MAKFLRMAGGILFCIFSAIMASLIAVYIFLELVPCSVFGSSFEGACGYRGAFMVLGLGSFLAPILSAVFVWMYWRRLKPVQNTAEGSKSQPF